MNRVEKFLLEREMKKMLSNITAHPKTTLAGAALAGLGVLAGGRSWESILISILTAVLGALAKDPGSVQK